MEFVELTAENTENWLDQALKLQSFLVSDKTTIDREKFLVTAKADESYFLGLFDDTKLVGMGVLSKIAHPVNLTGYINNIVVHPDQRGQGYFGLLMDELETKAKAWGCTDIALTCSREPVQNLYQKRGYRKKDTNFYIFKL